MDKRVEWMQEGLLVGKEMNENSWVFLVGAFFAFCVKFYFYSIHFEIWFLSREVSDLICIIPLFVAFIVYARLERL